MGTGSLTVLKSSRSKMPVDLLSTPVHLISHSSDATDFPPGIHESPDKGSDTCG